MLALCDRLSAGGDATDIPGLWVKWKGGTFKNSPVPLHNLESLPHPDYEMFSTGIHAYRGVSCADCHMPYQTTGGVKFTDHHVQSPLLNIANSCAVCHRWSEKEIRTRVETIQTKVANSRLQAEDALVKGHFDVAAAMEAKVAEADLAAARTLLRR